MWPDYSVCDFCPYAAEYTTSSGTVCENCERLKAERKRNELFARYECEADTLDEE